MATRLVTACGAAAVALTSVAGCSRSHSDVPDRCQSDVEPAVRTAVGTMAVRDGEVSFGFVATVDDVLDASGRRAQLEGPITNGAVEMCLMVVRGQVGGGSGGAVLLLSPDKTTRDPVELGEQFRGEEPPAWVADLRYGNG
jgi:hypothetical protein